MMTILKRLMRRRKLKQIPPIEVVAFLFPDRPFYTVYSDRIGYLSGGRIIMRARYENGQLVVEEKTMAGKWWQYPPGSITSLRERQQTHPEKWRFVKPVKVEIDD